jgi:hypothetical protein
MKVLHRERVCPGKLTCSFFELHFILWISLVFMSVVSIAHWRSLYANSPSVPNFNQVKQALVNILLFFFLDWVPLWGTEVNVCGLRFISGSFCAGFCHFFAVWDGISVFPPLFVLFANRYMGNYELILSIEVIVYEYIFYTIQIWNT